MRHHHNVRNSQQDSKPVTQWLTTQAVGKPVCQPVCKLSKPVSHELSVFITKIVKQSTSKQYVKQSASRWSAS